VEDTRYGPRADDRVSGSVCTLLSAGWSALDAASQAVLSREVSATQVFDSARRHIADLACISALAIAIHKICQRARTGPAKARLKLVLSHSPDKNEPCSCSGVYAPCRA
jgi:hypothetical protein